jgi:DNA-binding CsgD family transcriptional regulator
MSAAMNERRKSTFVDNTFKMFGQAMGSCSLVYYSVDQEYNLFDFRCVRVSKDFIDLYRHEMHHLDPLHVRRVASRRNGVLRMDQAGEHTPPRMLKEYTDFLRRYDIVNNIDLLFRVEGEIRAGLGVLWTTRDPPPTDASFRVAAALQPYIEYVLCEQLETEKDDPLQQAIETFHLTPREVEVIKLLRVGRTNVEIASCLGIGVSTVKTHLIRIFDKTGAENRSGLVARLSAGW